MKFNCGRGKGAMQEYWTNWHRIFAWYPIQIDDFDCRWLEYVERKYRWVGASGTPYDPSYRAVPVEHKHPQQQA